MCLGKGNSSREALSREANRYRIGMTIMCLHATILPSSMKNRECSRIENMFQTIVKNRVFSRQSSFDMFKDNSQGFEVRALEHGVRDMRYNWNVGVRPSPQH